MTTFPVGLFTRSLGLPIRKALGLACDLGAEGVVIDARNEVRISDFSQTSYRQFRKLLEDDGLRVAAVAFPTRRGFYDLQDLDRRLLATREAMSFAYKLALRRCSAEWIHSLIALKQTMQKTRRQAHYSNRSIFWGLMATA